MQWRSWPQLAAGGTVRRQWQEWARKFIQHPESPPPPALAPVAEILTPAWRQERRQAQAAAAESARLQGILDGLDTAVAALDPAGRLLFANHAANDLWPLHGTRAGERPAALARIPELAQWLAAGKSGRKTGRLELADGRVLQVEVTPWAEDGVVLAARDITALARLETVRRDFIAAASHELRTPVTSIRGYAEILQEDLAALGGGAEWREPLAVIQHNARRLEKLAADLVTLSSMETGQYPFQFQRLNAAELLAPAAAVLRPLAAERGAVVTVGAAEPGWVRGDAEALHRALLNLGENALVHGTQGAGAGAAAALAVELSGQVCGGDYRLQVRDNGVGISSLDQPHVFERFYRADKSHARPGGSGLGLALVKHIAQEHGGTVEMASRLGSGSSFTIRLPLFAGEARHAAPAAATREEKPHA